MSVCLMSHIPYDAVFGGIVDIVQRYGNLRDAETRRQMTGVYRQLLDNRLTQLLTDGGQLVDVKLSQVVRVLYMLKQFHCFPCLLFS